MNIEDESGKVTFTDVGELLSESARALSNTNAAIEKAIVDDDKQARTNALITKALLMANKLPNDLESFEASGGHVPAELIGVVNRLSNVALDAFFASDWDTITQLPTTKDEDLPSDILDRMAKKYE